MNSRGQAEKRDSGEWIQFLQTQIENRNSEIALLRSEVQDKSTIVEEMQRIHEQDTVRLTEMTEALVTASSAIQELESQVSELRETESRLSHDVDLARSHVNSLQQEIQNQKLSNTSKRRLSPMGTALFLFGIVVSLVAHFAQNGNAPEVTHLAAKPLGESLEKLAPEAQKDAVVSEMALQSMENSPAGALPVSTPFSNDRVGKERMVTQNEWMSLLSQMRSVAFSVDESDEWSVSKDYKDQGFPIVITRAQFRDVVSKTLPTALPSRGFDGVFLYDIATLDADKEEMSRALKSEGIPAASLCRPWDLDVSGFRRLSIVVTGNSENATCLKNLMTSQWFKNGWEEISIVNLAAEARFSASSYSDKKFFSFQEWAPDWIPLITVGAEPDTMPASILRARRLVSIARVLTKSSDVLIEVPVAESKSVSFGNFAVIPAGLVKGPVRATRISVSTGRPVGKTISQPVASNAKAVIINGAEAKPEKSF